MKSPINPLNGFPNTNSALSEDSPIKELEDELCDVEWGKNLLPSLREIELLLEDIRLIIGFAAYPSVKLKRSVTHSNVMVRFHVIGLIWRWQCQWQTLCSFQRFCGVRLSLSLSSRPQIWWKTSTHISYFYCDNFSFITRFYSCILWCTLFCILISLLERNSRRESLSPAGKKRKGLFRFLFFQKRTYLVEFNPAFLIFFRFYSRTHQLQLKTYVLCPYQ